MTYLLGRTIYNAMDAETVEKSKAKTPAHFQLLCWRTVGNALALMTTLEAKEVGNQESLVLAGLAIAAKIVALTSFLERPIRKRRRKRTAPMLHSGTRPGFVGGK